MSKKVFFITILASLLIIIALISINLGAGQPVFSQYSKAIFINEIMSSNKSILVDAQGNTPDWIELYNSSDKPLNLEGFGLSDNASKLGKWVFPNLVIPPEGYLIVFASGLNTFVQNQPHTNFRIDSDGEEIILSDSQGNIIDQIEIPQLDVNISFGRKHDSLSQWVIFENPTPGYPNSQEGIADFEATRWAGDSSVYINEVMADNISILQDEDGDYTDWIEICNNGASEVNMADFFLSGDIDDLFQWRFPDKILKPGQNLIVYCSGKNRSNPNNNLHSNFKINKTMENIYFSNKQGKIVDFAEIRNLPGDHSLIRNSSRMWELSDQPTPGFPNTDAGYHQFIEANLKGSGITIWEVMSRNNDVIPDENGNFYDWIEIKNTGDTEQNLGNYWLSDDGRHLRKWKFPSFSLKPGEFVIVFLSSEYDGNQGDKYLHANFALSGKGEMLYLSDSEGSIVQKVDIPELTPNISYGRIDNEPGYFYFSRPTPGYPNDSTGRCTSYTEEPVFSENGGFFSSPIRLIISSNQDGATIRYTTDGSEPNAYSPVFSGSITIDRTTVVRARAYKKGYLPSKVITNTYLFEPMSGFATVSISTDPENLWSEDTGIYTFGHNYEPEYPYHGANFWQEWEKPAHIEFFETDGTLAFSLDAGISIHGEYTQALDQKSFGIDARKKYGSRYINYPVFPEKQTTHYQSIVLRNSGQDNGNTKIRDVLISQLMKEYGLEYQAYRPSVLYLNGEYWGFYTLRESTDRHFIASCNPSIDKDNLDIIEGDWRVHQGDRNNFLALQDYIKNHDMSIDEHYQHVSSWMDVDNFIDYQIAVIYGANVDNGNIKYWRERKEGSKWRWILYDFDMAFRYPEHDTVSHVFNPAGTGSGKAFSTVIQMGLLQNQQFREQFLRRFAYHMRTTFEPEHVLAKIDEIAGEIEPEIKRNYTKWKGSYNTWQSCITKLKDFFVERPAYARKYIQQYFNLTESQMREYGF